MTAITPRPAGSAEERLDAAAAERQRTYDPSLPELAWDPDSIPEEFLPLLAWAHSVDEWNPAWDVSARRDAVQGAVDAHALKGTAAGVRGVLERVGAQYTYEERIGGARGTARVVIHNPGSIRISDAISLESLIDSHKRGTVHMTVELQAGLRGEIPVAGGVGAAMFVSFDLEVPP